MCRFVAYLGEPLVMQQLLAEPVNSLIKQSKQAREMINSAGVNGDGFGIGWYNYELSVEPGMFKSVRPAWNDVNLDYLLPKLKSHCFLGHIRAAVHGGVDFENSHPFHHGKHLFMHNGTVAGFPKIKRHLRRLLSDDIYEWIKGQTDSEHIAALYLQKLAENPTHSLHGKAQLLVETFRAVIKLQQEYGISADELTVINYVVTDGESLIVSRFCNDDAQASTLYYATGTKFECIDGVCHLPKVDADKVVVVASEKLDSHLADWQEVPKNHIMTVSKELKITLHKI